MLAEDSVRFRTCLDQCVKYVSIDPDYVDGVSTEPYRNSYNALKYVFNGDHVAWRHMVSPASINVDALTAAAEWMQDHLDKTDEMKARLQHMRNYLAMSPPTQ